MHLSHSKESTEFVRGVTTNMGDGLEARVGAFPPPFYARGFAGERTTRNEGARMMRNEAESWLLGKRRELPMD